MENPQLCVMLWVVVVAETISCNPSTAKNHPLSNTVWMDARVSTQIQGVHSNHVLNETDAAFLQDGLFSLASIQSLQNPKQEMPRFWQPQKLQFMPYDPNFVLLVADTQNQAIRVVDYTQRNVSTLIHMHDHPSAWTCLNTSFQDQVCGSNLQDEEEDSGLLMPYSFAVHPYQTFLIVADTRNRALRQYGFFSHQLHIVAKSLSHEPLDVVWASKHHLFVLLSNNQVHCKIWETDELLGNHTNTWQNDSNLVSMEVSVQGMVQVLSLAYDPDRHALYMADFLGAVIFKVELSAMFVANNRPVHVQALSRLVVVGSAYNPVGLIQDNQIMAEYDTALDALLGGPTQLLYVNHQLFFTDRSFVHLQTQQTGSSGFPGSSDFPGSASGSAVRYWDIPTNKVFSLAGKASERALLEDRNEEENSNEMLEDSDAALNTTLNAVWGLAGLPSSFSWDVSNDEQLYHPVTTDYASWIVFSESDANSIRSISTFKVGGDHFPCRTGFFYNFSREECLPCQLINPKPLHVKYIGSESNCAWACTDHPFQQPFACDGIQVPSALLKPNNSQWAVLMDNVNDRQSQLTVVCTAGFYKQSLYIMPQNEEDMEQVCFPCEAGFYCDGMDANNGTGIEPCPQHSLSVTGATKQTECQCLAGFFKNDSTCHPCPVGYYCPFASLAPQSCPPNSSTTTSNQVNLLDCVCKPGFVGRNGPGPCEQCPADLLCPGGNSSLGCPMNTRLVFTSNFTKIPFTNLSQCKALAGFFQKSPGLAGTECFPGSFCPGGNDDSPLQCPLNSNSSAGSSSIQDCKCKKGLYLSNSTLSCQPCPKGFYCNAEGKIWPCPFNLTTSGTGDFYLHFYSFNSKHIQDSSGLIRTHQDSSGLIRTHQDSSGLIRTHPMKTQTGARSPCSTGSLLYT
jgi:hypothetical protein